MYTNCFLYLVLLNPQVIKSVSYFGLFHELLLEGKLFQCLLIQQLGMFEIVGEAQPCLAELLVPDVNTHLNCLYDIFLWMRHQKQYVPL